MGIISPSSLIIYHIIAFLSLSIISGLIGSRIETLYHFSCRPGVYQVLILSIYAVATIFIFSTNCLLAGWPHVNNQLCRVGIYLCLACYIAAKTLVYLLLLYRVRLSRKDNHVPLKKDFISAIGLGVVVAGVTVCATMAFMHPVSEIDRYGQCNMGLEPAVSIALIALDVNLNLLLTCLFVVLCSRLLRHDSCLTAKMLLHALPFGDPTRLTNTFIGLPPNQFMSETKAGQRRLEMAKALWATIGIILPTAANLGVMIHLKGHERGWLLQG
ncbi:MAG: hypothetical protein Q9222_001643 [Ikaeria aurantiellina]